MALRTGQQPVSRLVIAVVVVVVIAVTLTVLETQTYVTNIFGDKIPG